jgi:periodic tryptophan protein 2
LDLGRSLGDHQEAKNKADRKSLRTISYLSDGEYIIGGGNSKNICIYDLRHRKMIKKIVVTKSRSLQGTLAKLNSRNVRDGMNVTELDSEIEYQNKQNRGKINLMEREKPKNVEIRHIALDPSG